MIGTLDIKLVAAAPQKPLTPVFSFKNSPSSLRLLDCPKSIGNWSITSVYIIVKNPDNTTSQIDCVRTGNVWVGTFNGCSTSGKVLQGVSIMADGVDENGNPVEGYCLGKSDYYVIEGDENIKALVGKTTVRFLSELPDSPTKGDMMYLNNKVQIFDGEKWVYDIIPSKTSDLVNDSGFITSTAISDKRDYEDLSYSAVTMDADPAQFGIDEFAINISGSTITLSKFNIGNHIWYNSNAGYKIQALTKSSFVVYFPDEYIPTTSFTRVSDSDTTWNLTHNGISFTVSASPLTSTTIALANAVPWRTSELNNDAGFLTSDSQTIQTMDLNITAANMNISSIQNSIYDIVSAVSSLSANVSAMTSCVVTLNENVASLTSSVSNLTASVSTLTANVTTLSANVSTIRSSVSAKRDITDKTWNYTLNSDNEMYGIQKFYVTKDTGGAESYNYDLTSFDTSTKVWSATSSPVTIKAINKNVYALIDENNPHTFEYDDVEYSGWAFYRYNDTTTQWTIYDSVPIEYTIYATKRTSTELALKDKLNVAGIGCSTVAMSGSFSDQTSFSYNFVIQQ